MSTEKINLFWYSIYKFRKPPRLLSTHSFRKLLNKEKENYGDLLSKYVVEKINGKKTAWYNPRKQVPKENFLAIGSILNYADAESIIWGSGIIDRSHLVKCKEIRAVRGPLTRNRLQELGISCPEIYGDPALLLPEFYKTQIKKKFKIGVVPHWMDSRKVKSLFSHNLKISKINLLTANIERTTDSILECNAIISSSLHGMIVAHAYNIPAMWVKFSDNIFGDDVKYNDYLESVGLKPYKPEQISETRSISDLETLLNSVDNLPDPLLLSRLKKQLIQSCPFT